MRDLINGPNFSGRSAELAKLLRSGSFGRPAFYIGPYAEAALSGLTSTIADEIDLYRARISQGRPAFAAPEAAATPRRRPQTLSGGEQVLLALHCFSLSSFDAIGIDTAFEQLDPARRAAALDYLDPRRGHVGAAALIDNRLPPPLLGWYDHDCRSESRPFACDPLRAIADLAPRAAPPIAARGLSFAYRGGEAILQDADFTLEGARAYRLSGANGSGKSTLLKLLVGVLTPGAGELKVDGKLYRPWRHGNRMIALAMQNPDHQWCGATLDEDLRRRAGLAGGLTAERVAALAAALGGVAGDRNLYELPLTARKRLSWLWPFAGTLPWVMFDEPSIGQDLSTRLALAAAMTRLCELGFGVMFVTHDDDFAARVPHTVLTIGERTIRAG